MSGEHAQSLLSHYFRLLARQSGARWDSDNEAEVGDIVADILEGPQKEIASLKASIDGLLLLISEANKRQRIDKEALEIDMARLWARVVPVSNPSTSTDSAHEPLTLIIQAAATWNYSLGLWEVKVKGKNWTFDATDEDIKEFTSG